jgi:2-oxoglutarate ferredoxin oxidoreductase subunit alpha
MEKGQVVKANSYIHDEFGYARENPEIAKGSADNHLQKELQLAAELKDYEQVKVYGEGGTALLCWGSCKGVCLETAAKLGMKVIQILVMAPFSKEAAASALKGVERLISVECNANGQLAMLMAQNGFQVHEKILKYDGRPFALEELEAEVKKVMK